MIGRGIDRVALAALGAAGLYLFFLNAGFGIPLSASLCFSGMALIGYLYRFRPWRGRVSAARARAALHAIALLPEEEAIQALKRLTGRDDFVPIIKHPDGALSAQDVFSLWRAHMGEEMLVLVATCPAEPGAAALAETLEGPKCIVINSSDLMKAIRATGLYVPEKKPRVPLRRRFRHALSHFGRANRSGAILYGASLLGLYLLTGRGLYLACALLLIAVAGISLIK